MRTGFDRDVDSASTRLGGQHRPHTDGRVHEMKRTFRPFGEEEHSLDRLFFAEGWTRFRVGAEILAAGRLELFFQPGGDTGVFAMDADDAAWNLHQLAHRRIYPTVGRRHDADRIVRLVAEIAFEG